MSAMVVNVSGPDRLALVPSLLQRSRLDDPTGGVWEAADLYWWWRSPRSSDDLAQPVWLDDAGDPVAACVFTEWKDSWTCDPMVLPSRTEDLLPIVIAAAAERLDAREITGDVVMAVPDRDAWWKRLAAQHGFSPSQDQWAVLWMDSAAAPPITDLPDHYLISDRVERAALPHHFDVKYGGNEQARLSESPLYRRDLDLCVVSDDGDVASYGLFWFDPVTRVGMVEPMRTEDAHQGLGLAQAVLTAGLSRLVAAGAERLKVSVEIGNVPASASTAQRGSSPHASTPASCDTLPEGADTRLRSHGRTGRVVSWQPRNVGAPPSKPQRGSTCSRAVRLLQMFRHAGRPGSGPGIAPRNLPDTYSQLMHLFRALSLTRDGVHVESRLGVDEVADRLRGETAIAAYLGQGGTSLWSGRVGPGNRAMLSRASRPPLGWFLASYLSVRFQAVEEGTRITGKVGLHPVALWGWRVWLLGANLAVLAFGVASLHQVVRGVQGAWHGVLLSSIALVLVAAVAFGFWWARRRGPYSRDDQFLVEDVADHVDGRIVDPPPAVYERAAVRARAEPP